MKTDIELAKLIAQRDSLAVRVVTRRNNQCLYRTAWSVLKDRADAEEAVQEGYLKGFAAIDSFAGVSSLSTWFAVGLPLLWGIWITVDKALALFG